MVRTSENLAVAATLLHEEAVWLSDQGVGPHNHHPTFFALTFNQLTEFSTAIHCLDK